MLNSLALWLQTAKATKTPTANIIQQLLANHILEFYSQEEQDISNHKHNRQIHFFNEALPGRGLSKALEDQAKIEQTSLCIIGLGGIGSVMLQSFLMAGFKKIAIVDFDKVERTNLSRQLFYKESDIGKLKTDCVKHYISEYFPGTEIQVMNERINSKEAFKKIITTLKNANYYILSADECPELVNWASDFCTEFKYYYLKCGYMNTQGLVGPLLGYTTKKYEELYQSWSGQINDQPKCIKDHNSSRTQPNCVSTNAIIGNMAVTEIIKNVTGIAKPQILENRILFNMLSYQWQYG